MNSLVTWLLPVKNGMPHLSETLASIAAQTLTSYEVLAWDNGSTDGSIEELRSWIPDKLPGRVVTNQPLGLGDCLATMVQSAQSEFCARIDADDINFPGRLEIQLDFLNRHPEIAIVGSQVIKIDEQGRAYGQYHKLPLSHDDIVHRNLHSWVMWHPTVLFRRTAVLSVGNYRNWEPLIEDYDLWMRLAVGHRLSNLDACLVKYRVREEGATLKAVREGTLNEAILKCFAMNAPALFGCSEQQAKMLRRRKCKLALPIFLGIALHLCKNHGGKFRERLHSESWRHAVDQLVTRRDVVTRAFFTPPSILGQKVLNKVSLSLQR